MKMELQEKIQEAERMLHIVNKAQNYPSPLINEITRFDEGVRFTGIPGIALKYAIDICEILSMTLFVESMGMGGKVVYTIEA